MFKYWIKNRLLCSVILVLVLSVVAAVFFISPNINTQGENRLNSGVYKYSEIDYDIPSPTKAQLEEIAKLDFVDDVFGYYFTESTVKLPDKSVKTKLIFSDHLDSLGMTMYSDERLVEKSEQGLDNPIYVDYKYFTENELSLGDTVKFNDIEFQVGRVYETNDYYGSAVFVPLVGEQKAYIESATTAYSGAYLSVNDESKAETYLRNYKPLGRLRDRDSFDSDEAYQKHYDFWYGASYYNEITSFSAKREMIQDNSSTNYIVAFAVAAFAMFATNIVLSLRKREKVYFSKKKLKSNVKAYFNLAMITDAILLAVGLVLGIYLSAQNAEFYVPAAYITKMYVFAAIFCVGEIIITAIYNKIYYSKVVNN